jgi:hypothetical protein
MKHFEPVIFIVLVFGIFLMFFLPMDLLNLSGSVSYAFYDALRYIFWVAAGRNSYICVCMHTCTHMLAHHNDTVMHSTVLPTEKFLDVRFSPIRS